MNKADYKNICAELNARKASKYKFDTKGSFNWQFISMQDTEDLEALKAQYEFQDHNDTVFKIKNLVDDCFRKYGCKNDNMILIKLSYRPEYDIYDFDEDLCEGFYDIDWLRSKIHPIAHNYSHNDYGVLNSEERETDFLDICDNYSLKMAKLVNKIVSLDVKNLFENEGVNECWYGCVGITPDYKVIKFVIRDDGMLCNDIQTVIKDFNEEK